MPRSVAGGRPSRLTLTPALGLTLTLTLTLTTWRQALAASKVQRAKNKQQGQPSSLSRPPRSAEVGRRTPGIQVAHPLV